VCAIISGGETTVTVQRPRARGGRKTPNIFCWRWRSRLQEAPPRFGPSLAITTGIDGTEKRHAGAMIRAGHAGDGQSAAAWMREAS
jgi:glycerate-2-kinase